MIVASNAECVETHSVVVKKPPRDYKIGLGLTGVGDVKITSIAEDGMFAGTALKCGMHIHAINSCRFATAREAVGMMKAAEDEITIVASYKPFTFSTQRLEPLPTMTSPAVAIATKPSKFSKLGIGLTGAGWNIVISSLSEDSLFANTDLKVSMKLETINNYVFCNAHEAITYLKEAKGQMVIVASNKKLSHLRDDNVIASSVAVSVKKPSRDCKVGIGVKEQDGVVKITSINEDGLFHKTKVTGLDDTGLDDTGLKVGMKLETINSQRFATAHEAVGLLKAAEDQLAIVASNTSHQPRQAKPTPALANPINLRVPPGAPSGGVWGSNQYRGSRTTAIAMAGMGLCGLLGVFVFCCRCDEREAYKKDDVVSLFNERFHRNRLFFISPVVCFTCAQVYLANGTRLKPGASFVPNGPS